MTSTAGSSTTLRWADSRSCPSLVPELAALATLEPFSIQPPGVRWPAGLEDTDDARTRRLRGAMDETISDGSTYEIDAPGHWVKVHVMGGVILRGAAGSPAAYWVEHALKALHNNQRRRSGLHKASEIRSSGRTGHPTHTTDLGSGREG